MSGHVVEVDLDASGIERVVVLYYGRDGSVAEYELTGIREGSLSVERHLDEPGFARYRTPLVVDTSVTLTVEASRYKAIIRPHQEGEWPAGPAPAEQAEESDRTT